MFKIIDIKQTFCCGTRTTLKTAVSNFQNRQGTKTVWYPKRDRRKISYSVVRIDMLSLEDIDSRFKIEVLF